MRRGSSLLPVTLVLMVVMLGSSLLTACGGQTTPAPIPTAAQVVPVQPTQTAQPEQPTLPPPTPTNPIPTSTETQIPTATAVPATATATATPIPPLALTEQGISGWCQPDASYVLPASYTPAANGKPIAYTNGAIEVNGLPSSACQFFFTFNQPLSADVLKGIQFQAFETKATKPWLTAALEPVADQPNTAGLVTTHTFIIAPPFWDVSFEFALVNADGTVILRVPANLHRWKPAKCFNGMYPNINTLRCPLWQDLHPWDPGYGKFLPTFTPEP